MLGCSGTSRSQSALATKPNSPRLSCLHGHERRPWCLLESDQGDHGIGVRLPPVVVDTHGQGSSVPMAKPSANRWDVYTELNAGGGKKVSHRVVRERRKGQLAAGGLQTLAGGRVLHDSVVRRNRSILLP